METINARPTSPADAVVFLQPHMTPDLKLEQESVVRHVHENIVRLKNHRAYTANRLAHKFNKELVTQSNHERNNDQLTQQIEQIYQTLQQSERLATTENRRLRKRFLTRNERLQHYLIGDEGVVLPEELIVAVSDCYEQILREVKRRMSNTVFVESVEAAFEMQKRLKSCDTFVPIVVVNNEPINATYSTELQVKDVIQINDSNEHVSAYFKSLLPSMTVTETPEGAQAISSNPIQFENVRQ